MDIDLVVPWVDGNDPAHAAKRNRYIGALETDRPDSVGDESTASIRWECAGEIVYALHSIARNLPFVRRVWLITDNQQPPLAGLPPPGFARKSPLWTTRSASARIGNSCHRSTRRRSRCPRSTSTELPIMSS